MASAVHSPRGVHALLLVAFIAFGGGTPPDPQPFRREMAVTERVETHNRMFARLLLGGRVTVLAREGSLLSITEVAGATTIEVHGGRVAVTVDRENLHPEDLVQVRTPHAVVTVPSETLIVDVKDVSMFTAVGHHVDVFRLDPVTGAVLEPPTPAATDEVVIVEPRVSNGVVANR